MSGGPFIQRLGFPKINMKGLKVSKYYIFIKKESLFGGYGGFGVKVTQGN